MDAPDLPAGLLTLLELARAEAKRLGHDVGAVHVGLVLAQREQEQFDESFGEGSAATVTRDQGRLTPGSPSPESLLASIEGPVPQAVLTALRESLGPVSAWVKPRVVATGAASVATGAAQEPTRSRLVEIVAAAPAPPSRRPDVHEVVTQLARMTPGNPLIVARSGSGRTAMAAALAAVFDGDDAPPSLKGSVVVRLATDRLLADNPVQALSSALSSCQADDVVFIDDLEVLLGLGTASVVLPALLRLRAELENPSRRIVLCVDGTHSGGQGPAGMSEGAGWPWSAAVIASRT